MPSRLEALDAGGLLSALPLPALLLRADAPRFTIEASNPAFAQAVSIPVDELVGKGLFDAVPVGAPDSNNDGPRRLRRSIECVLASGRPDWMPVVRHDVRLPDGSFRECHWTGINVPLRAADGTLAFVLHLCEDVTDLAKLLRGGSADLEPPAGRDLALVQRRLLRHARELTLSNDHIAQREAQLSAVFDQTPLIQGLIGLDGTLLRGNDLTFTGTGFARERQLGRKFWEADWWDPAGPARDRVRDAVNRAAVGETVHWRSDYIRSNGERRRGEFAFSPIRDPAGRVALVCANARDCTEEEQVKAKLAAGKRRYRSLLSNLPGIVFRGELEPPWRLLYISDGIERLSGYPPAHFVDEGHPYQSLMLEEDVERVCAEVAAQTAAGEPIRVEYRIRHRDGSIRWVEGRARLLEETPGIFDGTVFDIDDRKRAEQALEESREHFHYTTQNAPCVLWTALPDGGLDFVSDASIKELGVTPGELLRNSWLGSVHPDDVQAVIERWRHSLVSGEPYDTQFRLRSAQGEFQSFQVSAECRRDPAGHILRWYGVLTNIEELVRTQARLRESEELARATLQTVPGIVWRARASGKLVFVSDACLSLLGYTPAEVLAKGWASLVHPDDLETVRERYFHSIKTGENFESRHRLRHAQGTYHWYQVDGIASRGDDGRAPCWYGLATDIEDVLQARISAETAARAKSTFLSTMSHEIRTPLNAVLGFASLLGETELAAQQRDFVNSIRASGDHLLGVINDILDFSKLESGGLALDFAPCNLRELVESALDLVASQAAAKNLELICRIAQDVPSACLADGARLRQVLVNLLGNAVKFTLGGEVEVSVSSRPLAAGESEFEFRVRDTGPGIPADGLLRLFRDFSQVDDSIARRFGGTGLGLAISKRLVEAHGGVISVDSRLGVGSTFCVRLPARVCPASAAPAWEVLRGRRVLVVDDNLCNLDALCEQLRSSGMQVSGEQEPMRALDVAARALGDGRPFELALVDQHMPVLDGMELARRLHALAPLPIVLLTSLGTTLSSMHAGQGFLSSVQAKPVHRATLLDALCGALEARPAPAPSMAGASPAMPALRLLLVEDNAVNRKLALLLLRKFGYAEVDVAVDGVEALDAVRRRAYDVVLMDVQMPNLDGLEATRRIRREIDAAHQPQIVAMTANVLLEDREACLSAGMDAYIAKPITAAHLRDTLQRAAQRLGLSAPETTPTPAPPDAREEAEARASNITAQVLAGGGEMGALMRAIDWSHNPLGPVYTWPQSLRTALSMVLAQKHPLFVAWGPELIQFYNDAYRPMLGRDKHPAAMGQRTRESWPEIWATIGPMLQATMERGESLLVERGLLCPYRNGYYEEGYFTYSYSPIRDESGGVGGVLLAASENTAEVIAARRDQLLLALDEFLTSGTGPLDRSTLQGLLAGSPADLPFALGYATDSPDGPARRICLAGLAEDDPHAPPRLQADDALWPVFECLRRGGTLLREDVATLPVLPPWPEPVRRVLLVRASPSCVLIAGISPRLPLDAAYTGFLTRLAIRLKVIARRTGAA